MTAAARTCEVVDVHRATQLVAAVGLLRTAVPPGCAGLAPYDSPRIGRYLAAGALVPAACRTLVLRGIEDGALHAVADWRVVGRTQFLNGLAVAERSRGAGLARRLLADGVALARTSGCDTIELDVATDNVPATRLYEGFGFAVVGVRTWAEVVPAPGSDATTDGWRIGNWSAFTSHHQAYGFADLELSRTGATSAARVSWPPTTPEAETAAVRVLPAGWRVPQPELAASLVASLGAVLPPPDRVFVAQDRNAASLPDGLVPLAEFRRMSLRLAGR